MNRLRASAFYVAFLLASGCLAQKKPASLRELDVLSVSEKAKQISVESSISWSEAMKFAQLSNKAMEKGERSEADRLASLGIIHMKLAFATAELSKVEDRFEESCRTEASLESSLQQIETMINEIEIGVERARIRRQLETAFNPAQLKSAAAKDQREEAISITQNSAKTDVRVDIAAEMNARLSIWNDVLSVFLSPEHITSLRTGVLSGESLTVAEGEEQLDLTAIQQRLERFGIEAERLVDEAWLGAHEHRMEALQKIESRLSEVNITDTRLDFGASMMITAPAQKRNGSSKEYAVFASIAKDLDVKFLILPPSHDSHGLRVSDKSRESLINNAMESLVSIGIQKDIVVRGSKNSKYPVAFKKGGFVSVLIIPIPSNEK